MATTLLAAAAAGILLPIVAAANAQTDARRRVVATRFAADVVERYVAGETLSETVTPAVLGYSGAAYQPLSCILSISAAEGLPGLTIVTVAVKHNDVPMMEIKTLIGSE